MLCQIFVGYLVFIVIKHCSKEVRQAIGFALLGKPVKILTGKEFQKYDRKITDKVTAYYQNKYCGKVKNKEIGEVSLDLEGIKDDVGHILHKLKCCTFMAVPDVIMYGKIFNRETNWKNRKWDSFVIIAPIKIGTIRYIEEVIVKKGIERQGLYLHEVEIKKKLENFIQTHLNMGNSLTSKLIIAQKISKVKQKFYFFFFINSLAFCNNAFNSYNNLYFGLNSYFYYILFCQHCECI